MSVGTSIRCQDPELVLLRWFDTPESSQHEELAELIEADQSLPVVRISSSIDRLTRVYLIEKEYMRSGLVRSCRAQGSAFILTIDINDDPAILASSDRDPGVFSVEDFITEEQETEILRELEESDPEDCRFQ